MSTDAVQRVAFRASCAQQTSTILGIRPCFEQSHDSGFVTFVQVCRTTQGISRLYATSFANVC